MKRMHFPQAAPMTMPPEQRSILNSRWREATARQPELKKLLQVLLSIDGDFVVAPPFPDLDVEELIASGFVLGGPPVLKRGQVSKCHENAAALWPSRKYGIVGIGTGYALSGGLWRQHSWGILREGILETTQERTKYFGLILQGPRADRFAKVEACYTPS
jgi:hypothetical protein